MFAGWASFGGVEIINNARAAAYGAPLKSDCLCEGLPEWLGDVPYGSPDLDPAPWWDAGDPQLAGFLGFVGLGMDGIQRVPVQRSVSQLIGDGGALGALRYGPRDVTITAAAIALDECAMSAGLSWLAAVLEGRACGTSCDGETLCVASCCPVEGSGPELERFLYGVGIVNGLDVTRRRAKAGGVLVFDVEFTVTATNPWIWRPPAVVGTGETWTQALDLIDPRPDEPVVADCLVDPLCPAPTPPPAPPLQVDDCYPVDPYAYKYVRMPVPASAMGSNLAAAPVITIESGTFAARRIMVRWMSNPLGLPCDQLAAELDDWQSCAVAYIGYVPASTTLVIDTRTKTATVTCPGAQPVNALPKLLGIGGRPFAWPVIECATAACVEVSAWDQAISPDARVTVELAEREALI